MVLEFLTGNTPEDFEDYYFIEIGIGSAEAGSSDSIYIYLDNDSSSVKGIHLEIGYDDSSFSITDTSLTTRTSNFILASNCCPYPLINPSGVDQINLLGAEGDSLTPGSGPILELEFEVDDSTPDGYYHFYLTEEVLFAPNHKPVFTIPLRGKFFVPSPPPVSIVCTPIGDTLLTPGDTLTFNSTLTNHSDSTKSPKFFIYGTTAGPDSFTFLAVDTTQIMILPAGGRKRDITELEVPSGAPQGHYTFTAYVVSPVTDSTFDNDAFGFQVDSTYNRPGYGGNELSVTGTEIKPWKILSGWFGYNERNAEGSQGIGSSISLPKTFSIVQNFPNPFNPSTTIGYEIPNIDGSLPVNLSVYDLRGRLVIKLVDEEKTAGRYQVHWDGKNKQGQKVASGVYIYRIVVGDFVSTRKMILVR